MTERARVLKVGGGLLGLLVLVLVIGFVLFNRGDGKPLPQASSPSPTPTDVHAQVEAGYLAFWDSWKVANDKLDPAPLDQTMTGSALAAARELIQKQQQKNQPVRVEVAHKYAITLLDTQTASLDDQFIDHSVRLDPNTRQPVEKDPNHKVHNTYTLRKVDGQWKVAEIIGFRPSPSP
jgi:hypothetical protein